MVYFENIAFSFDGKYVMQDFTERIGLQERVAVMGESGAGKSTLINSLMGLCSLNGGNIFVDGDLLSSSSIQEIRSKIAWVPQEIQLPYDFVKDAIKHPYRLKVNAGKKLNKDRMYTLFDELGLDRKVYDKRMYELSGGERQRLMLVSAVLLEKKILLLDEPTSALDPMTREKVIHFLLKQPVTLIAVTHDEAFAEQCDRIVTLTKNRED